MSRFLCIAAVVGVILVVSIAFSSQVFAQTDGLASDATPTANAAVVEPDACSPTDATKPPIAISTDKQATRWLKRKFKNQKVYNAREIRALEIYSHDSSDVNRALRSNENIPRRLVRRLDLAIKEVQLCRPLVVYRGSSGGWIHGAEVVGKKFEDLGYVSTSLRNEIAARFAFGVSASGERGFFSEMVIPAGTSVATPSLSGDYTGPTSEFEVLLPRDTDFEILTTDTLNPEPVKLTAMTLAVTPNGP